VNKLQQHLRETAASELRGDFVARVMETVRAKELGQRAALNWLPCSCIVVTLGLCLASFHLFDTVPRTVEIPPESPWAQLMKTATKIKTHL